MRRAAGVGLAVLWAAAPMDAAADPFGAPAWSADPTDQTSAYFGREAALLRDTNGDGYDDLAVGAPQFSNTGRVYVYYGGPGGLPDDADFTSDPTDDSGSAFAGSLDGAGDVNGDGYADLVAGAAGYTGDVWTDGAQSMGRAYLYLGGEAGFDLPAWVEDSGAVSYRLFGSDVAGTGDVNGDGYDDVAIGASGYGSTFDDEGRVFVYHGRVGGLPAVANWTLDPTDQAFAHFGHAVAGAGDANADGYADVIVGAYGWDGEESGEGRAYLYLGSASGLAVVAAWTADPTDVEFAQFGSSVAGVGDVNGDGYSDVVVGAPQFDGEAGTEGRAYLYLGTDTGLEVDPAWTADPTDTVGAEFGTAVSAAGDVDGDGLADVLVGTPEMGGRDGRVDLYLGSPDGLEADPFWTYDGDGREVFGSALAGGGDFDGDGAADIVVGAERAMTDGETDGIAYAFYGSDCSVLGVGAACADADVCNGDEVCGRGECLEGLSLDCDDGSACTTDACDPATGCTTTPIFCDDAILCTIDSCDPAVGCTVTADDTVCGDAIGCTTDRCVVGVGCERTPDDGSCNDGDPCTDDVCRPWSDCAHPPNEALCDDGDECTTDDRCNGADRCIGVPVPECEPPPDAGVETDAGPDPDDAGGAVDEDGGTSGTEDAGEDQDAGSESKRSDDGGCGCRAASGAGSLEWTAGTLALVGIAFRRRRGTRRADSVSRAATARP